MTTYLTRVVLRLTGTATELLDLDTNPADNTPNLSGSDSIDYGGTTLNQTFREIAIHNLTDGDIAYALDLEDGTIDLSESTRAKTVPSLALIGEALSAASIRRIRIYFENAGNVEVILLA